jgi:hypothetical protein
LLSSFFIFVAAFSGTFCCRRGFCGAERYLFAIFPCGDALSILISLPSDEPFFLAGFGSVLSLIRFVVS